MDELLDPRVVAVPCRRLSVFPSGVVAQSVGVPVRDIEGRISDDEVSAQVGVKVSVEAIVGAVAEVGLDVADGEVHLGESPGRGGVFLTVDGDVAALATVGCDELCRLDEHAT